MGTALLTQNTTANATQTVTVITDDQVQIGDIVYTLEGSLADNFTVAGLDTDVQTTVFSLSGDALVLGGKFAGYAKVYSVSGTTITYVSDIYADAGTTALNGAVNSAKLSPSGDALVLGGSFTGYAKVYSVSGTTITFVSDIYANTGTTAIGQVTGIQFSPSGDALVVGVNATGYAKVYSVSGTTITYVSDIAAVTSLVTSVVFSPSGDAVVFGSLATGKARVYSVSGTTITFVSEIYADAGTTVLDGTVVTTVFSPSGDALIVSGGFTGKVKVYSVSGTTITFVSNIYADTGTTALNGYANSIAFSPSGNVLVLAGGFTGYAKIYSVSGTTITYVRDIYANTGTTALSSSGTSAYFLPSGNTLVLTGNFTGYAKVYSVSGTTITYVSDIYANTGTTALNGAVLAISFLPSSNTLVFGGGFAGYAKVYSVSGTTITFASDIYANAGSSLLRDTISTAVFSPSGDALVIAAATGLAKVYSVSGTTLTFVSNIALNNIINVMAFSPSGDALVLGGTFTGYAKVYSVSGTTITFVSNIYADAGTTALNSSGTSAYFSPSGNTLVLSGYFTGYAKVYSVSGTTLTFVSNIYADTGTTALNGAVTFMTLSPSGDALILGGNFTGRAKVYSVSGTTITFVSDIYADAGTTVLSNSATSAVFSPSGDALVLGGSFTGYAKVYSVSGTTITFVSNISLSTYPSGITFSPSGDALVLFGNFTGYAKIYSVSGTTVTFVSNIYANAGTTALNGAVNSAKFSPSGDALVLGGAFTGYAKVYSVSGATLTYVSDIYANTEGTALTGAVNIILFIQSANFMFFGGSFQDKAKSYYISGTTIIPYKHAKHITNLINNVALNFTSGTIALNAKIGYCTQAKNSNELLEIQVLA